MIDLQRAGEQAGIDFAALQQMNSSDPSQVLAYLSGVSTGVRTLGREEIDGVATTGYALRVDLRKAARHAPRSVRGRVAESLRTLIAQIGSPHIPTEVWIDDDGLVRRQHMTMEMDIDGTPIAMDMTMDVTEYGVEVDVTPPPAADTVDITEGAPAA